MWLALGLLTKPSGQMKRVLGAVTGLVSAHVMGCAGGGGGSTWHTRQQTGFQRIMQQALSLTRQQLCTDTSVLDADAGL